MVAHTLGDTCSTERKREERRRLFAYLVLVTARDSNYTVYLVPLGDGEERREIFCTTKACQAVLVLIKVHHCRR
jgi:hypothetical protein